MIKDKRIKEWYNRQTDRIRNDIIRILDVDYAHLKLADGADLYVTGDGMPFLDNLRPDNFLTDKKWFEENSVRLSGTSCLYRVRTKRVGDKEKDLVVKWNRMGQEIPGGDPYGEFIAAEFNSPFEEFSLVRELRVTVSSDAEISRKIIIQKPLGIYVPLQADELDRLGRKKYKMQAMIDRHKDIALDMNRSYAVIYEWIKGIDVTQAHLEGFLEEKHLESLTLDAEKKIEKNGFCVWDRKPHHIIIRPQKEGKVLRGRDGDVIYGLIDFELLDRTPKMRKEIFSRKRKEYHLRQKDRFSENVPKKFHPHLNNVKIFDVDYIFGHVESTDGKLWVVGKDPYLFDYFLPERWEGNTRKKISMFSESYYTVTKDSIHIVWEVSRVGVRPDLDPYREDEDEALSYGYNSPFEEVAFAVELNKKGVPTIYPRAIYMSGRKSITPEHTLDISRYNSHKGIVSSDSEGIMQRNRSYIIVWGYWNGPDEKLADRDGDYYDSVNALYAYQQGVLDRAEYIKLIDSVKKKLYEAGIEDLNLRGDHFLISFDNHGELVLDKEGEPEVRVCNFEFFKRK